jgi:hypothetical protein
MITRRLLLHRSSIWCTSCYTFTSRICLKIFLTFTSSSQSSRYFWICTPWPRCYLLPSTRSSCSTSFYTFTIIICFITWFTYTLLLSRRIYHWISTPLLTIPWVILISKFTFCPTFSQGSTFTGKETFLITCITFTSTISLSFWISTSNSLCTL